ncbi:hypothetical protein COX22_02245 [Candidatus Falkowbacteria bacterium CG23_combo_of_CG06-09_8_20_14_all_49_15]|uniref:Uncharacterized protein n=1 Tax=Candidatus Falkowbacteria bacterium CG23_combo_of_CG06-09_8_20_14_all_49_15 TaxID=1974572 RepID=A0A2G9ZKZ5_9BACT|nr:MAG: hypothetical protein COX22_02245 [Candidatus Falkowbacteria bacterium CG23_combo_of_CG06-09_8_20_14_all_49_15]
MNMEKIDREKPATLDDLLAADARKINDQFGPIVQDDCSIAMDAFAGLDAFAILDDQRKITAQEQQWSDAHTDNPKRLAWFQDKGLDTPEKRWQYWRARKAKSAAEKMEKAIVVLFNKMFGQDFIVVRTARYDDYFSHVDTLIIDVKNKKVVGAFDEVRGEEDYQRNRDKAKKFQTVNGQGAQIKYGLTVQDADGGRTLARQKIDHLPLFIISLNRQEVDDLAAALSASGPRAAGAGEKEIFQKLIKSLQAQINELEKNKEKISRAVWENSQSFKNLLADSEKFF